MSPAGGLLHDLGVFKGPSVYDDFPIGKVAMKAEGIMVLSVFLLALVGIGALAVSVLNRARRKRVAQIQELCALVSNLERDPSDSSFASRAAELVAIPSVRASLLSGTVNQLWKDSLAFALAHIELLSGKTVAYGLLVPLSELSGADAGQFLGAATQKVLENPGRRAMHETVMNCLRAMPIAGNQRQWFYESVLKMVQSRPEEPDLAVLALEAGRWHLGRSRPDGNVTIYDEQAIQNDISVRRGRV